MKTARRARWARFNGATQVLECAMAGLRELPFNLVVTTGPGIDPARFGPQPAHVRVERYIPYALLLPRCSLVVSQLLIPQGGDQAMLAAIVRLFKT